jgi:EpsI family protein
MHKRLLTAGALMLLTAGYLSAVSRAEPVPPREALAQCPLVISDWRGRAAPEFDEATLAVLGVDEYIHRIYRSARGTPVNLYIGYYGSQREGDTMHSPLKCLPGAGWTPVRSDRLDLAAGGAPSQGPQPINRYVIEKGLDRQVVLYWYQSHGRVIASEYWGKVFLVLDALRLNRTDGALVRIMAPVLTTEAEAERDALEFARTLAPLLGRYLPS